MASITSRLRNEKHHTYSVFRIASLLVFLFFLKEGYISSRTWPLNNKPLSISTRSLLSISESDSLSSKPLQQEIQGGGAEASCEGIYKHRMGFKDECAFVKATQQCNPGSLIDYTAFFFCTCSSVPMVGYLTLLLWLAVLFYMLGNTAADYFCCSLEKLSELLNCPATVAGVTLLPLGNGAPDVFASIAAFVGAGAGEVGLNSVLGGAIFVTTVVAGLVNLTVASRSDSFKLDRNCYIRDICFFLITLVSLFVILFLKSITFLGSFAFFSIYILYAISVAASEFFKTQTKGFRWHPMVPLPFTGEGLNNNPSKEEDDEALFNPLLDSDLSPTNIGSLGSTVPQWMWASHVAIYSQQVSHKPGQGPRPLWGWSEEEVGERFNITRLMQLFLHIFLTLPRQLTIPIVEEERWSRGIAVVSAGLAPVFFCLVLTLQGTQLLGSSVALFMVGVVVGGLLGSMAFVTTTHSEGPPSRFLFPWVAGGFVMSIVWFYVIANELVGLLVTFGTLMEINPSILGLTVLAWGNSMGDLMSNIALASNGGDGVQIAISGCYAGPMFNTLVGLGISLLLGSWGTYPASFVIPIDHSLFYTLGFLMVGLVWALVVLPMNGMRPNKMLGVGLLILYSLFLGLRLAHVLGIATFMG